MVMTTATSRTDVGRVRGKNETTIAFCEPSITQQCNSMGRLYLLCDDVGGYSVSNVASRLAVETITRTYYDQNPFSQPTKEILQLNGSKERHLDGFPTTMALPLRSIRSAFVTAHRRITQLSGLVSHYAGMATTCIAAVVKENTLLVAHVGDSRAYLVRDPQRETSSLTCLTTDHSLGRKPIQTEVRTSMREQISSQRPMLTRTLGGQQEHIPLPDSITCHIRASDRLLLCSDGLWSRVSDDHMEQVLKNKKPQQACDELIRLANETGGDDTLNVILLSFTQ